MHFRFFCSFQDFNCAALWEGAIGLRRLYGMNYKADQALRLGQKIVEIGHELMEL